MRDHWAHSVEDESPRVYRCTCCGRAFAWGRDSDHDPEGWWVSCDETCSEVLRGAVIDSQARSMPAVESFPIGQQEGA